MKLSKLRQFEAATIMPLLVFVFITCFGGESSSAAPLPDHLTVTSYDIDNDGINDTIILHKRSIRADNFRLWTWTVEGGYEQVIDVPDVCTYRGYVEKDPSLRVNGFINYLGNLAINVNDGRNNTVARSETISVDLSGAPGTSNPGSGNVEIPLTIDRVSPTAKGFLVPKTTMRKMRVGFDTTHAYCQHWRFYRADGSFDIGLALAAAEQRINDTDMFYARDMGLAWEVTDFVLRLDGNPSNWKTFWRGNDGVTPLPFNTKVRLDGDTGGGSGGSVFSATKDFPDNHSATTGAPKRWESASIGHEVGHGLNVGHYSSHNDTVSGSESALGTGTVQRMIEQLHLASEVSAPAITYGDEIPPYAMEDYANTPQDQSVDLDVLENDYDGNGDAIHVSYVDAVTEAGGTVTILGNGMLRYTPPAGYLGVDRFHYYVADEGNLENRHGDVKIYVRNNGLANHWTFDETSGSTLSDLGPNQAHGYVGNKITSLTNGSGPGVIGNAYTNLMVKEDSRYGISFDSGDPLDGDLSVSTFVKFDTLPSDQACILSKGGAVIKGRIDNIRGGWSIGVVNGKFYFACKLESDLEYTNPMANLAGSSAIEAGQWYHLAMTMDRSNHELRAWIDGVPVTVSPAGNTYIPDGYIENYYPLSVLNCGRDDVSIAGSIDDLRIYNRALTTAEVSSIKNPSQEIPAGAPTPRDAQVKVNPLLAMKWVPGKPTGYEYDVYLGTNRTAVANATTSSNEYIGRFTTPTCSPELEVSTTYFWRVDEVTSGGTLVPSNIWTFHTDEKIEFLFDNGGSDPLWTTAENWKPDGIPSPEYDYRVTGNYSMMSPGGVDGASPISYTFAGKSLTISDGATLNLKKSNGSGTDYVTTSIPNLTIDNATLMAECWKAYDLTLDTGIHMIGDNTMTLGTSGYSRWFRLTDGITGSGSIRLYRTNAGDKRVLTLSGGDFSQYSGDWTVNSVNASGQLMELSCETPSGWGTGNLTLGNLGGLTIKSNISAVDSFIEMDPTALMKIDPSISLRIGELSGSGSIITGIDSSLLVGQNHKNSVFSGVISGEGSFIKEGGGLLTLTGLNTYTGTTTVTNDGTADDEESIATLRVDGSLAGGPVTVTEDTALGGNGNIGGTVTIAANGFLTPGNDSIGTLTLGSAPSLQGTITIRLDRAASQNSDQLVLNSGTLTFGGSLKVNNIGEPLKGGDTFTLFEANSISGTFTNLVLPELGAGQQWDTSQLAVNGTIRVKGPILSSLSFTPNSTITVDYQGILTPKAKDWIGIYNEGAGNGAYLEWKYTGGSVGGSLSFAGRPAGNYEARLFADNGYTLLASVPFTVTVDAEYRNYIATQTSLTGVDAAADADPNGDGVNNLLKYAFGLQHDQRDRRVLDPNTVEGGLPFIEVIEAGEGGHDLRITFVRRMGSQLQYVPETSISLDGDRWSPILTAISTIPIDETWELAVYQQHYSSDIPCGFIRMSLHW